MGQTVDLICSVQWALRPQATSIPLLILFWLTCKWKRRCPICRGERAGHLGDLQPHINAAMPFHSLLCYFRLWNLLQVNWSDSRLLGLDVITEVILTSCKSDVMFNSPVLNGCVLWDDSLFVWRSLKCGIKIMQVIFGGKEQPAITLVYDDKWSRLNTDINKLKAGLL